VTAPNIMQRSIYINRVVFFVLFLILFVLFIKIRNDHYSCSATYYHEGITFGGVRKGLTNVIFCEVSIWPNDNANSNIKIIYQENQYGLDTITREQVVQMGGEPSFSLDSMIDSFSIEGPGEYLETYVLGFDFRGNRLETISIFSKTENCPFEILLDDKINIKLPLYRREVEKKLGKPLSMRYYLKWP
jgi:hypothetical protein